VWCDGAGVTCRRWNWRQARRTQLREDTAAALFILDALDPVTGPVLEAVADDLVEHLRRLGPDLRVARRTLAGPAAAPPYASAGSRGDSGAGAGEGA
jgi:DNA/RNA-binding domain of Phe-tRNA-synthetase-like protein